MFRGRAMISPRVSMPSGWNALIVTMLACGLAAGRALPVAADDYEAGETLLGTVDIPARSPAPAAKPLSAVAPARPSPAESPAGEPAPPASAAQTLFDEALADLGAGQLKSAERLFERVIATDPESPLAARARAHLAELYRGPGNAAVVPAAATPARQPTSPAARPAPRDVLAPELRLPGERPPAREAALQPVSGELAMRFIVEAGDRVFFSQGSDQLGGRARQVLEAQARFLKKRTDLYALIEGHADDQVPDAGQRTLSEQRAAAVRDRLIEEGVDPSRLVIVGYARERPLSDCPSPDCAAQNRRAITVLTSGLPQLAPAQRAAQEESPHGRQGVAR